MFSMLLQNIRLVTLAYYPLVTAHLDDVVRSQFLQVNEGEGCEVHKHEEFTDKGEIG